MQKIICPAGTSVCTPSVGSATVTNYVYDAFGNLAAEYAVSGHLQSPACTRCYLIVDHLGSTRALTDGTTGSVVERHDYLPFGEEIYAGTGGRTAAQGYLSIPDPIKMRQRFTGKERDAETSLDFFEARYFSGAQGRFTSPDGPFADQSADDPQSWNLYSYGRNNPLTFIDPTGTTTCDANGNNCYDSVTVSATAPGLGFLEEMMLRSLLNTMQTAQQTQQLGQMAWDWMSQPRNPMCTASYSAAGATIGALSGGGVGALGFAGGPVGLATTPAFSAGGAALGTGIGGLVGMAACTTGSGGGGGGGGDKRPKSGLSGKEGAKDVPSWAKGQRPRVGESGKEFAKRLLDGKYGTGNYDKGPTSEFNRIQKWGDRAFE